MRSVARTAGDLGQDLLDLLVGLLFQIVRVHRVHRVVQHLLNQARLNAISQTTRTSGVGCYSRWVVIPVLSYRRTLVISWPSCIIAREMSGTLTSALMPRIISELFWMLPDTRMTAGHETPHVSLANC